MNPARIAELLKPFLSGSCHSERSEESAVLTPAQLLNISTYIDLLLRWNARINLTAIRQPEEIVTRHFGESLFAATHLFPRITPSAVPSERSSGLAANDQGPTTNHRVVDIGSGAGFPGLPIKIWAPQIHLTLIESNQKKATFLREVVRTLTLTDINVFAKRAEAHSPDRADVVTLRAVENFHSALPTAIRLLTPTGHLAVLVSEAQLTALYALTQDFSWQPPIHVPLSATRVILVGTRNQDQ
jgi:16S rRNA (guanine527-N7)-methyltransferase